MNNSNDVLAILKKHGEAIRNASSNTKGNIRKNYKTENYKIQLTIYLNGSISMKGHGLKDNSYFYCGVSGYSLIEDIQSLTNESTDEVALVYLNKVTNELNKYLN